MIAVQRTRDDDPMEFEVLVEESRSESRHQVTMSRATWSRLGAGVESPEACVEAAFRFLMDREPKESILGRFDLTDINRYFPDFERELPRYLAAS
jgi:hypothetical protein